MLKRLSVFFVAVSLILCCFSVSVTGAFELDANVKSAILIEPVTGEILYERAPDEKLAPASVTKIMTALLVMEAIDSGKLGFDSDITVSAEASAMGGSQIFLEAGEVIKVNELLKGMMVASGNDAAVAFAEAIGGTKENFVSMMNDRAAELGMTNTHFDNCHGLDSETHYTTARDISIMSKELLRHEKILEFTSIWTEDIRGGKTALANTNKLVRFYSGCDGLKTGSTSVAKSCISATAKRDGMRLIAVVMAAENSDARNAAVRQMFDFGFATKELVSLSAPELDEIKVVGGVKSYVSVSCKGTNLLCDKGTGAKMETVLEVAPFLNAPVKAGDVVGSIRGVIGDKEVLSCELLAAESVDRVGFSEVFLKILQKLFMG